MKRLSRNGSLQGPLAAVCVSLSRCVFSRCMEQVVERSPHVLGYSLENLKEHVEFLLNEVGVSKAKLGQVRYCLLLLYAFCEILQA